MALATGAPTAEPDPLLAVLRPKTLLAAALLSVLFGALCLKAPAVWPVVWAFVGVTCLLAFLSPTWGFVLCVFLFAFRNDAFTPVGGVNPADATFVVTTLSWLCRMAPSRALRWHWTLVPLALYCFTMLLSGFAAKYPSAYLIDAVRTGQLVMILALGMQVIRTPEDVTSATKAFLAAGLAMAVCAVLGAADLLLLHGDGVPFTDAGGRAGFQSICVDPLRVSSFLIFPMLVAATLQQQGRTRYERWVAAALFWLGLLACLLSFSRSAILQILPGLFVLSWLTRRHWGKLLSFTGALAAALALVTLVSPTSEFAQKYRLDRWALAGRLAQAHTEPRLVIWDASYRAFQSSPWIGVGLDNFSYRYLEFRDPWLATGWVWYAAKRPSHSAYLAQLAETGLVGTAAFLALLLTYLVLGRKLLRRARAAGDRPRYLLLVAILGAYVGQLVAGTALELFAHNHVWVLLVLLTCLDRPDDRSRAAADSPPLARTG